MTNTSRTNLEKKTHTPDNKEEPRKKVSIILVFGENLETVKTKYIWSREYFEYWTLRLSCFAVAKSEYPILYTVRIVLIVPINHNDNFHGLKMWNSFGRMKNPFLPELKMLVFITVYIINHLNG